MALVDFSFFILHSSFLQEHWLDITTTILGLAYIILEYKASIWLWLVGFVMQALGIVLYYQKGLYADCGMEFYYLSMTVYGFVTWKFVKGADGHEKKELPITHFKRSLILPWVVATLAIWFALWWFLVTYTDSRVPIADSFTTALSFVGIWALARKYLEQWLIWIVVDVVTCALYFYKDIPFKASLYALYVVIAIAGYYRWRKEVQG
ncbi:MAG: nicotinamide mononucleotide transporter [Prevotella sp.]|nr:nicotinamide mononucleotide transporter [Prevotella sp.]MBQ6209537.1 nicotinamide mononucleotide transporter [Prevotella sp.]